MLSKKSPVKLLPSITGMLDGANHPINPNPITLKSFLSQSLSKHVYFPPEARATLSGFLGVTGLLTNPEVREEETREAGESEEVPRPTTVDAVAKVVDAISSDLIELGEQ